MARPANGKYCYVHVANLQVAFNRFGKQTDCMVDEDFVWPLAQELVKIDSSDPGAYKGEIEQHIKDLVETYVAKLDSPVLDTAEIRELVYICHMDTVTLGDGWNADTTVGFFTGYTDTAVIAGKTGNRNCVSYGPGSLALAHKPNEYVPHADIVRCQNVLIALADNTLWSASGQVGA